MSPKESPQQTDTTKYTTWFRQASPYINAHRGKTFVLMLPGAAMEHSNFINIIGDIALMNSLGIKLAIVHGARPQIDARLSKEGVESDFHKGLRITDPASIECIAQALGTVRMRIEAALSTGLPNTPTHGAPVRIVGGNFVSAMPCGVIDGVDLMHTGKVRKVHSEELKGALGQNNIVLISPMGYSPTGEAFNLPYSEVATKVALALKADKLIAFCSQEGALNSEGTLYRELTLLECQATLGSDGDLSDHRLALEACYKACDQGVPRAHMLSYAEDGALIRELFTRDGAGTMVHRDSYDIVRRARIDDVAGLLKLISPLEEQGILVRRSRERLEMEADRFIVMEKDGAIIGCAALYPFLNEYAGELACVVVHPDYRGGARAAKLLKHVERQAKKLGFSQLFTLTTQTEHWFLEQGFEAANIDTLPSEKKTLYNYQRNSKIFVKKITD